MYYNFLGAFFLQSLATKLNILIEQTTIQVEDKELDNIMLLLCCMFAFKVSKMFFFYQISHDITYYNCII